MIDYLPLQSQVTIKEKGYRSMMAKNNLTGGGVQMETYQELSCHFLGLNKLFLHLMRAPCFCTIIISYLLRFHVYYYYVIT